jgi:hypothetical protein
MSRSLLGRGKSFSGEGNRRYKAKEDTRTQWFGTGKKYMVSGMAFHACNSSTQKLRQEDYKLKPA